MSCMFKRFFLLSGCVVQPLPRVKTLARLSRAKHHHQIMKPKATHSNHWADSGATHLCWVIPRDFLSQVPPLHVVLSLWRFTTKNAGWLPKTLIDDVCQNTSPLKYQLYFFGIPFASLLVAVMTTSDSLIATPKSLSFRRSVQHTARGTTWICFSFRWLFVFFFPWHGKIKKSPSKHQFGEYVGTCSNHLKFSSNLSKCSSIFSLNLEDFLEMDSVDRNYGAHFWWNKCGELVKVGNLKAKDWFYYTLFVILFLGDGSMAWVAWKTQGPFQNRVSAQQKNQGGQRL